MRRAGPRTGASAALCVCALLAGGPAAARTLALDLAFEVTGAVGYPPDTMGAVGPDAAVTFLNGGVSVFRKSDGSLIGQKGLAAFWSEAGVALPFDTFDPRVVYDPASGRFFAVALNGRLSSNEILVAVSSSSDPGAPWTGFALDSDSTDATWADFPTIGVDADTVTIASDMLATGGEGLPIAVDVLVIPKADLVGASPTLAGATLFERAPLSVTGFAPQPVTRLDGGGLPGWLLSSGVAFTGVLQTTRITGSAELPAIAAGPFLHVEARTAPPEARQPDPNVRLDTGDGHFASLVRVGDSIWGVHGTTGDAGRAAIRWLEFDAATAAVRQSGVIEDPDLDFLYPSLAANPRGDVVIGFSGSGASLAPSAFAVLGETAVGTTTFGAPVLVLAGSASLPGPAVARFGDYSATALDPSDASRFWTFQEIGTASGGGVAVASLRVAPEPEAVAAATLAWLALCALAALRARDCDGARLRSTLGAPGRREASVRREA